MGVVGLLQRLGRELDLALTAGSIERAKQATLDGQRRRALAAALEEAVVTTPDVIDTPVEGLVQTQAAT